jgi:hypothetical protein
MDVAAGWLPDPEREGVERYWNGSEWTDQVRPAPRPGSFRPPDHLPQLQRALAAATDDIDVVEARLSVLFERAEGVGRAEWSLPALADVPTDGLGVGGGDRPMRVIDDDSLGFADEERADEERADEERADDERADEELADDKWAVDWGDDGRVIESVGSDEGDEDVAGNQGDDGVDDATFTELDAALAAEEPEPATKKRGIFRRRS